VEPNYIFYTDAENASDLYHIYNNSFDAGVNADKAWTMGASGEGVVVAVIDTGVDLNHNDLFDNIWENPGEIGNCSNGIDDDDNGYIDDCWGWDTAGNDNNPNPGNLHGTHVAGTIAAVKDNSGLVGVAPSAKIMPVKVFSDNATGASADVIVKGIEYAVKNNADIINMSLGNPKPCSIQAVFADATKLASDSGTMVIAASGNSGPNVPSTPAGCPAVYGVGATTKTKSRASFSSYYNDYVDFVTPGVGILSTVPNNNYQYLDGTSMATPVAVGVAALVMSKDPSLSLQQVGQLLCDNAEDLGAAGKDTQYGCGFLDAEKIIAAIDNGSEEEDNIVLNPVSQTIVEGETPKTIVASGGDEYSYSLDAGGTGIEKSRNCADGSNSSCPLTAAVSSGKAVLSVVSGNDTETATITVQPTGDGDDDDDDDDTGDDALRLNPDSQSIEVGQIPEGITISGGIGDYKIQFFDGNTGIRIDGCSQGITLFCKMTEALESGEASLRVISGDESATATITVETSADEKKDCVDTEGDVDYFTKGTLRYFVNEEWYSEEDACDGPLYERYCEGDEMKEDIVDCEFGCEDGACKENPAGKEDNGDKPDAPPIDAPPPINDDPESGCENINNAFSALKYILFFANPINVFSEQEESILDVFSCGESIRINVGSPNMEQYVWNTIYISGNRRWERVQPQFESYSEDGLWGVSPGSLEFDFSSEQQKTQNFAAAYICTWHQDRWKCGCDDTECKRMKWYLRPFRTEE
jgi:subtilisin family serine protease